MFQRIFFILLLISFFNCSKEKKETTLVPEKQQQETLFELISKNHSTIDFKNEVSETLYFNFLNYSYIYNGGGVAVGDINNDELEDIYFSSNQGSNKLYLNKGNFIFEDITTKAGVEDKNGWSTGVSMIDINADGWLDIYVCKSGSLRNQELRKNKLFINQKDGTFKEQAAHYGLGSSAFSTQAYYLDFDKDGDLDVFLLNHRQDFNNNVSIDPKIQQNIDPESTDLLFENDNGIFTDITHKAGILNKAWGLSASIGDFNEDNWPDIYIANDFLEPDFLYINNKNGTFTNKILETFDHISANSMGSDYADINNDLLPDLIVLDMLAEDHQRSKENMAAMSTENFNHLVKNGYHHQYMSNMLQINLGNGVYSEVGQLSGIAKTDWSWSPLLADFDNDGFNDLFVTNGIQHDLSNQDFRNQMKTNILNRKKVTLEEAINMMPSSKLKNKSFKNNKNFTFQNTTEIWGLNEKLNSNGVAYSDLDNDGDLDLILNNQSDLASIYKNNQTNNSISISLQGKKNNPNGIGAKVIVHSGQQKQIKTLYPCRGFQSSVSYKLHFGLGKTKIIDSISIQWPLTGNNVQSLTNIHTNQHISISQKEHLMDKKNLRENKNDITLIDAENFGITYKNKERLFNDYNLQLLLPQKQSEKGNALSICDVNNDGRDDFFIGNGKGGIPELYIQNEEGKFNSKSIDEFKKDIEYEDNAALFFDMDNDGDQDLYIATGSYEDTANSPLLQDRLYENLGNGNFSKTQKIPEMLSVSTTATASDFDNDGDLDLFIGGGVIPGRYPLSYPSYILKNEQGKFIDATEEVTEGFDQLRMVNDAIFSDYDQDGDPDLLIVGEWMPITIFTNYNGHLKKASDNTLSNSSGWYFTIQPADINHDGNTDYLIGNIGQNNKFHPTIEKPFHIYANDFDGNGSFDIILSKESKSGILVPVRGKECSSEQIPVLQHKFKTYKEFASASLPEIYGKEDLSNATHYIAQNFSNILLKNNGNGSFDIEELPKLAQFGPTTDFLTGDFNNDGYTDIFSVGTLYEAEAETIRYDANKGYFIFGNKENTFNDIRKIEILHQLQVRKSELIVIHDKKYILLLCKNEGLKLIPM